MTPHPVPEIKFVVAPTDGSSTATTCTDLVRQQGWRIVTVTGEYLSLDGDRLGAAAWSVVGFHR